MKVKITATIDDSEAEAILSGFWIRNSPFWKEVTRKIRKNFPDLMAAIKVKKAILVDKNIHKAELDQIREDWQKADDANHKRASTQWAALINQELVQANIMTFEVVVSEEGYIKLRRKDQ
jgi:hypothetical protein